MEPRKLTPKGALTIAALIQQLLIRGMTVPEILEALLYEGAVISSASGHVSRERYMELANALADEVFEEGAKLKAELEAALMESGKGGAT